MSPQMETSPSASPGPVTIFVAMQPKPGHLARLLDLCTEVGCYTREHEPRCTRYSVYRQRKAHEGKEGKERKVYLFQRFLDEEAFQDHICNEHHDKVLAEIKEKEMLEQSIVNSELYMEKIAGFDKSKPSGTYDSPEHKREHRKVTKDYWGWDVVSVLHPKQGAIDDVVHACGKAVAFSVDEPGCRKMEVYRQCFPSKDEPAKVVMMERFMEQVAFEAHIQAEAIGELMRHCEEKLLVKPIEPEKAPSDEVWEFDNE